MFISPTIYITFLSKCWYYAKCAPLFLSFSVNIIQTSLLNLACHIFFCHTLKMSRHKTYAFCRKCYSRQTGKTIGLLNCLTCRFSIHFYDFVGESSIVFKSPPQTIVYSCESLLNKKTHNKRKLTLNYS